MVRGIHLKNILIAALKRVLCESAQLTAQQKEVLDECYEYADIDEYEWSFVKNFPMGEIYSPYFKTKRDWLGWLKNEELEAKEQYGNADKYKSLIASDDYPIIITGKEVVDGNHRVAIAYRKGLTTIPAIVGTKKP
jgi:hypothetical protein